MTPILSGGGAWACGIGGQADDGQTGDGAQPLRHA